LQLQKRWEKGDYPEHEDQLWKSLRLEVRKAGMASLADVFI
jgi:hypothetical protein